MLWLRHRAASQQHVTGEGDDMQVRRGLTVAGATALLVPVLVLGAGPVWADELEPLPENCRYVDEPGSPDDGTTDGGTAEPAPEETATVEPDPSATDEPPVEEPPAEEPSAEPTDLPTDEPTDLPTDEPTGEPTDEPTDLPTGEPQPGDGQVVVCWSASAGGEQFTGGGGGVTAVPDQGAVELPATGSSTGSAALLGLSLLVGGTALVLSVRAPRRT